MSNDIFDRVRREFALDKDKGWIFGVCAGAAQYFNLDPALIRVGVIVTGLFLPKIVIAAYLVSWLLLDERKEKSPTKEDRYGLGDRYRY